MARARLRAETGAGVAPEIFPEPGAGGRAAGGVPAEGGVRWGGGSSRTARAGSPGLTRISNSLLSRGSYRWPAPEKGSFCRN